MMPDMAEELERGADLHATLAAKCLVAHRRARQSLLRKQAEKAVQLSKAESCFATCALVGDYVSFGLCVSRLVALPDAIDWTRFWILLFMLSMLVCSLRSAVRIFLQKISSSLSASTTPGTLKCVKPRLVHCSGNIKMLCASPIIV
eukprot:1704676-Prymnesium_polylepis.1